MTGKLHEVLAVEDSLGKASKKLITESKKTLSKDNLFKGSTRALTYFAEEMAHLAKTEYVQLETTVDENLNYVMGPLAAYWDAVLQKDATNQNARADLIVDGKVLAKDVPATFLLGLEAKLGALRELYEAIPTLPPGIKWVEDTNERKGVFMNANDNIEFKTEKDAEFKVAYPATEQHPAQVEKLQKTVNIGKYVTTSQCGMLKPVDKADRLARIDKLLLGVKKSRARANTQEISKVNIGKDLLDYINAG